MKSKVIVVVVTFLISLIIFGAGSIKKVEKSGEMPIIQEKNPRLSAIKNESPIANNQNTKWLQSSFKIQMNSGESGSGSLCYYSVKDNTAYVISCGHLWDGTMSASQSNQYNKVANIITWYHNNKKLTVAKKYPAKVIFYSNKAGYDSSLLSFKPDWIPQVYYPISPKRDIKSGENLHSVGCDHGEEVANYIVQVVEMGKDPRGGDTIITKYNSPRPGRSGGGLMDIKGYLTGICWATSKKDGTGLGYFTSLNSIHYVLEKEGYSFLLNQPLPGMALRIPIIDHNNSKRRYSENYIILPN
jgi:hypothetical protein